MTIAIGKNNSNKNSNGAIVGNHSLTDSKTRSGDNLPNDQNGILLTSPSHHAGDLLQ